MPFKSKAQQRFMFAAEKRGDVPKGTAGEWARASEKKPGGIKALPEKVKKTAGDELSDLDQADLARFRRLQNTVGGGLRGSASGAALAVLAGFPYLLHKHPTNPNNLAMLRNFIGGGATIGGGLGAMHGYYRKNEPKTASADTDWIKARMDQYFNDPDRIMSMEDIAEIGARAKRIKFSRNIRKAGLGAAALGTAGLGAYGLHQALKKKDEPKTAGDEPGASDNKSFISRHPNVTGLLGAAAGWKEDMMARLQRTMSGTGAQAEQNVKDIASQTAEVADEVVNDRLHPAAIGALASLPGPGWVAAPIVAGFGAPKGRGGRAVANTILGEIGGGIAGALAGAALGHGVGRLSVLGKRFRVSPKELQKLDKIVKDDVFRRQHTADRASEAWNRSFEQGPLFPSSAGERPPTPRLWSSISASGEAAAAQHQMNQLEEVLARKSNRIGNVRGAGYFLGSLGGAGFGAGKGYDLATRDKPKEASALADAILKK